MKEALKQFTDACHLEKLQGGQNNSVKAGDIVLKPVDTAARYCWLADQIEPIQSARIRISRPVRSKRGNWVEEGYGATEFVAGQFFGHRMTEKLAAAEEFHVLTADIKKPIAFDSWVSPWSQATRVSWQEASIPKSVASKTGKVIEKILRQYKQIHFKDRFIHSDLAGNILFQGDTAVIIDLSPDFRPFEYAITMLVTDSIAWHNEPLESLNLLPFSHDNRKQLILRAVLFRLCVPVFFNEKNEEGFFAELKNFSPVLDVENIEY